MALKRYTDRFIEWGSLGKVGHSQKTAKRLLNVLGGYVNELGGYSYGAATVIMPHITGSIDPTLAPTKWEAILKKCQNDRILGHKPSRFKQDRHWRAASQLIQILR